MPNKSSNMKWSWVRNPKKLRQLSKHQQDIIIFFFFSNKFFIIFRRIRTCDKKFVINWRSKLSYQKIKINRSFYNRYYFIQSIKTIEHIRDKNLVKVIYKMAELKHLKMLKHNNFSGQYIWSSGKMLNWGVRVS
jgi:hypothetical protein